MWTRDSRGGPSGEPDLRLTWNLPTAPPAGHAVIEIELKARANGRRRHRTDDQRRYANAAILAGKVVLEILLPDDREQLEAALGIDLSDEPDLPADLSPSMRRELEAMQPTARRRALASLRSER